MFGAKFGAALACLLLATCAASGSYMGIDLAAPVSTAGQDNIQNLAGFAHSGDRQAHDGPEQNSFEPSFRDFTATANIPKSNDEPGLPRGPIAEMIDTISKFDHRELIVEYFASEKFRSLNMYLMSSYHISCRSKDSAIKIICTSLNAGQLNIFYVNHLDSNEEETGCDITGHVRGFIKFYENKIVLSNYFNKRSQDYTDPAILEIVHELRGGYIQTSPLFIFKPIPNQFLCTSKLQIIILEK